MSDDVVDVIDQREAARLLILQRALYDRLHDADKETRAEALPAWLTGEKAVGRVDGVVIGSVARERGSTTVAVTNWGDLLTWAEEHAGEDAWEVDRPYPSAQQITQAAAALIDLLPDVHILAPTEVAESILRAAMEKRQLKKRKVSDWMATLKVGGEIVSRVTGEVFTDVPGITVTTAPDKLVVRPDWKAVAPVVDRILSGPELKEVTSA